MSLLIINAGIQISKPVNEVFEAIVDDKKMSNYFISESSGRMEEGKELIWKFPEFEERFPIKVLKVKANELVSFEWAAPDGKKNQVEITLTAAPGNATVVKVTEGEMENNEAGIAWLGGNAEGWANFLACMKAYLEYGINLRKGAFDFRKV